MYQVCMNLTFMALPHNLITVFIQGCPIIPMLNYLLCQYMPIYVGAHTLLLLSLSSFFASFQCTHYKLYTLYDFFQSFPTHMTNWAQNILIAFLSFSTASFGYLPFSIKFHTYKYYSNSSSSFSIAVIIV